MKYVNEYAEEDIVVGVCARLSETCAMVRTR